MLFSCLTPTKLYIYTAKSEEKYTIIFFDKLEFIYIKNMELLILNKVLKEKLE